MYDQIFSKPPKSWGLRGDPYFWDALGWHLSSIGSEADEVDLDHGTVLRAVEIGFSELSEGRILKDGGEFSLNWLPTGGMSGGFVSGDTWRDKLLPEIINRADNIQKAREIQPTGHPAISYHPAEHRFRFAAWCASSAARQSHLCRFSAATGAKLLSGSPVRWLALGAHWLPETENFDKQHEQWCEQLMEEAKALEAPNRITGTFTYGVAAKLLNCYLKALFLGNLAGAPFDRYAEDCPVASDNSKLSAIHPPVDRILLQSLERQNVGGKKAEWRLYKAKGWSNFNKRDYQVTIDLIRDVTDGDMWRIEKFWAGHQ